ncbi:cell division protein ZapA [Herbaspirillum sp. LeCh32-8]|uniref:cell division protein ZapA n=1 Tax=Herbaspirillum sp. LeCh32-8 TaxID=2821356 RepID=UPI001AE89476|nr:cell division protein ZapA [Herbaspirillum sp. LeCh32-8]MBP0599897.1 cell division protein ZapA [Herbaspirillum sp. LeCh32-8]
MSVIQIQATIMGQPYTLACREGEQAALHHAVAYLDQKMRVIRDAGKIKGTDRIAVMAALGIAAELLASQQTDGPFAGLTIAEWKQQVAAINDVLDQALAPQEKLF